jgi:uncharacterized membrane protein (GlpM family)
MELLLRFLIGGTVVSLFAVLGDALRPKSFAGLFGAAPSIALATLALTIHSDGRMTAALEARSMIMGAVALLIYAWVSCRLLWAGKASALVVTLAALPIWFAVALIGWLILRSAA